MKKLIFLFVCFFFIKGVLASNLELTVIPNVYSNQYNLSDGSYFSSNQKVYMMDGRVVYCVEPGENIMTRYYNFSNNLYDSNVDYDVIDKISLIGYYGYDYPSHQTYNYFLAAQELIWEELGEDVFFTTGINNTLDLIDIEKEKLEIINLVNSYYTKPSFDGQVVSDVFFNTVSLIDSNNVLENYEVVSNNAYIDGNTLIIKLDSFDISEVILQRKKYDDDKSIFYGASNSQDFMYLRPVTDVFSTVYFSSYLPLSNISIYKTGNVLDSFDDGLIYVNKGLDDVLFKLYAFDDIFIGENIVYHKGEFIQDLKTQDGYASSINLPNGHYYLEEVFSGSEFKISDRIVDIDLDNRSNEVSTYKVNLFNERKKVNLKLHKLGEDGSFLENVKFGLYNDFNIYDSTGNILLSKDSLITSFGTDGSGIIDELLDLPIGHYYLKEMETVSGYMLDDNIYYFDLDFVDNSDITIDIGKIYNKLYRGNMIIRKIDNSFNLLGGACFQLFDQFDNVIYEGCSDNGEFVINDLVYGNYYFYEVSAPLGYVLDNKRYDVCISSDLTSVDVINFSMPVTSNIYEFYIKVIVFLLLLGLLLWMGSLTYDKSFKNS